MAARASTWLRSLPDHQGRCAAILALASLLLNGAVALHRGLPHPVIEDEYSYLLASDTFAHFRVTNPTPAFAEHFEAPHILVRPSYMSKYPPGQGLILGAGQLMTRAPIMGVWLVSAVAVAFIYWAFLGFLPSGWALMGGFLALVHPQLLTWSQTYWGGTLPMLGGAILLGAWVRMLSHPTRWLAAVYAVGLAILALTRPYEGLVLCLPLTILILRQCRMIALPMLVVLVPVGLASMYYNARITGHAMRMPFVEYSEQYDIYPKFWFLPKHPEPHYSSEAVAQIHTEFEPGEYDRLRTFDGFFAVSLERLKTLVLMHTQKYWLLLFLAAAIFVMRNRNFRWVGITLGIFLGGLLAENFFLNYYAAPATALMLLLIAAGWKWLHDFSVVSRVVAAGVFCVWAIFAVIGAAGPAPADALRVTRDALIADYPQLAEYRHIVFVKFGPRHSYHDEWVYNDADIKSSPIVWARYLGTEADRPVIEHFSGRRVWLLEVGENDLKLNYYPGYGK